MATFREALVNAARGAICSYLDGFGSFLRLPTSQLGGAIPVLITEMLRQQASRLICNRETPPRDSDFEGGQCPVLYKITWTMAARNIISNPERDDFLGPTDVFLYGKIGGTRIAPPEAGGNLVFGKIIHGTPQNPDARIETNAGGFDVDTYEDIRFTQFDVVRADGLPDECGNAPPNVPDYNENDYTFNTNIDYTDSSGNNITIPVIGVLGQVFIDANAEFNVPIKFTFSPNFSFNPQFKFDTDVNFNLNTGDFSVNPPAPTGVKPPAIPPPVEYDFDFDFGGGELPPSPPDVPDPTEPIPDPELKRVIRGAVVTVQSIPDDLGVGVLFQNQNPDIYYPDLGTLSFYVRTRQGGGAWTTDIRIKNTRQFIPCEWPGGAVDVRATGRAGVLLSVTRVYGNPDPLV